jgi:hypothetical protein
MRLRFAASLRADDGRKARPEPEPKPEPVKTLPIAAAQAQPTKYEITIPPSRGECKVIVSFHGTLDDIRVLERVATRPTGRPSS